MIHTQTSSLSEQYAALKAEQPQLRIYDAAQALGVSELELLELKLGEEVVRLSGDWKELLAELHRLDYVMALTRNRYVVHERKGVYNNVSFMANGQMGVAVNDDIDLRFFMSQWVHAYGVKMSSGGRTLYSFQFFNGQGLAIHKVYLTHKSAPLAYDELLKKYRAKDQQTLTVVLPEKEETFAPAQKTAEEIHAFQQAWLALQDTHDFFGLLKTHGLSRTEALRFAPEGHARQLNNQVVGELLNQASEQALPIMVFAGNSGCIQIHTGLVQRILPMDQWINVMDPEFNLHLNTEGIAEVWEVRKPTADGIVTSVEVFDATGELIVYFFGKRKPGIPEMQAWRDLTAKLQA